jgi:hypothetical protein
MKIPPEAAAGFAQLVTEEKEILRDANFQELLLLAVVVIELLSEEHGYHITRQ